MADTDDIEYDEQPVLEGSLPGGFIWQVRRAEWRGKVYLVALGGIGILAFLGAKPEVAGAAAVAALAIGFGDRLIQGLRR